MNSLVDQRLLFAGGRAPQDEHHSILLLVDRFEHLVGEGFPALFLMRSRSACPHGEGGVEEQNARSSPSLEVAVPRGRNTEVGFEFGVDVAQAGRNVDPVGDGKGKPVRLPRTVVGILAQDHHPDLVVGGQVQSAKHLVVRRVHGVGGPLGGDEGLELAPVGALKFCAQNGVPVGSWRHRLPKLGGRGERRWERCVESSPHRLGGGTTVGPWLSRSPLPVPLQLP